MSNSICIMRLSAIGDVLMFLPTVRAIQDAYPTAKITWVISQPAYQLVADITDIEFIIIEKPKNIADYWRFYRMMRNKRFDVLLAAQASLRTNLLYPFIKAHCKIGYDRLRANDGHRWFISESIAPGQDHTLEGFLKFAKAIGVNQPKVRWDIPINKETLAWAKAQLPPRNGPVVLLNPAASKPERSWLTDRYVDLINYLQSHWQAQIILIGGPGLQDKQFADAITQACSVTNLIGATKLKQLLALISVADLVICPDTGPSHMATAVNTPVIALHAVTNPDISGPYTYRHLVVDYYQQAMSQILHKAVATSPWGTQVHSMKAMQCIPLSAVVEKTNDVLTSLGF